jgi:hypothetical protein
LTGEYDRDSKRAEDDILKFIDSGDGPITPGLADTFREHLEKEAQTTALCRRWQF